MINLKNYFLVVIFSSISSPVFAYLDPATGSIILQGLIATIALLLGTFKFWWYRITAFFTGQKDEELLDDDDDSEEHNK